MAGKLISDLNSGTLSLADAMEIDKDVSGTRTSFKTTVKDIVDFANRNVADEYDNTSTYAIGDYVMYESTLYKCITAVSSAENFDSTKWTAVLVTDEMGSGGGGGTGGHTIIDENGNSMTARAGLQFVGANVEDDATNNKTIVDISGGGGGFGLVQSGHTVYTLTGHNLEVRVPITFDIPFPEVPNIALSLSDPSRGQYYNPQTGLGVMNVTENGFDILIKSSNNAIAGDIAIYWIATTKFSGNGIFQPVIYSTEEREIGVWTDGKPLYEKTWDFGSDIVCNSNSWTNTPITKGDIEKIVDIKAVNNAGTIWDMLGANIDQTYVQVYHNRGSNNAISIRYATLQYTKSTDTAGSGSWTPQGVPTHHYSTDEQIIGTWIDGSTLYEKTWDYSSSPITLNTGSQWTDMQVDSSYNIGHIVNAIVDEGTNILQCAEIALGASNYVVAIRNYTGNARVISYMTLQYTKSS